MKWLHRSIFDSLSPSKINHKHSRGVTYSVDPGNEGAQSSTSVPSEGEALCNVVDVDPSLHSEKQKCGKELERETQMKKILGDQNVDRQKVVDQNKDELKLVSKDPAKIIKQCEMVKEKVFEVDKERISCEEKQYKLKLT